MFRRLFGHVPTTLFFFQSSASKVDMDWLQFLVPCGIIYVYTILHWQVSIYLDDWPCRAIRAIYKSNL